MSLSTVKRGKDTAVYGMHLRGRVWRNEHDCYTLQLHSSEVCIDALSR